MAMRLSNDHAFRFLPGVFFRHRNRPEPARAFPRKLAAARALCPACDGTGTRMVVDPITGTPRATRCGCGSGYDRQRTVQRFLDGGEGVQG